MRGLRFGGSSHTNLISDHYLQNNHRQPPYHEKGFEICQRSLGILKDEKRGKY